jgi:glutamate synthase (NADPH/NADH) small chain
MTEVSEHVKDFNEVNKGLSEENAVLEALRCMNCVRPSCVKGCPVCIDIPAFVQKVANKDFAGAVEVVKENNMLPAICGRVCPQETQCEGACILSKKEKPVSIGALERFVADWEREHGVKTPEVAAPTGKKVAVVGSGPAGLTAAAELARMGHAVTVFESLHAAGGVLMYGIPNFRLPKEIVQAEIEQVKALGVEIRLNHLVGRSVSTEELLAYDAVFLGTGAGLPYFMGIEGENLCGVYSANEFLTRVNLMHANCFPGFDTPVKRAAKVVVAGGGNVAMDAARVARRLGADVTLVYRRREEDLPARAVEVTNAQAEGVRFVCCANPVRVLGEKTVSGVECVGMEMCALDESGRPKPSCIEGSNFVLEADVFIEAIGQGPNPLLVSMLPALTRERRGNVVVDADGQTTIARVYAGGDVATGAATVIWAMGSAKKAAAAIDRTLRGE